MAIASGLTLLEMKFFLKITSYLGKIAQRFRQTLTGKCFCNKQGQKCKVSKISFEKICNGLYCLSIYLENLYRYIYVNSCLSSLYVSLRYSQQLITVNARIQNFSFAIFLRHSNTLLLLLSKYSTYTSKFLRNLRMVQPF